MRRMLAGLAPCFVVIIGCASPNIAPQRVVAVPKRPSIPPPLAPPAVVEESRASRPVLRPSGDSWYPACGRISSRWTEIVIHHSATDCGGAARFDRHHRLNNGWDELGYHFVIGNGTDTPDGAIEVGSRWHKQKHGAHCKTPDNYHNEHGIGICLVGNFQKAPPSAAQLASLRRLAAFLMRETHIRPDQIRTHRGITGKTACPGRYFSLSALKQSLAVAAADHRRH